jgi:hypothetical protein
MKKQRLRVLQPWGWLVIVRSINLMTLTTMTSSKTLSSSCCTLTRCVRSLSRRALCMQRYIYIWMCAWMCWGMCKCASQRRTLKNRQRKEKKEKEKKRRKGLTSSSRANTAAWQNTSLVVLHPQDSLPLRVLVSPTVNGSCFESMARKLTLFSHSSASVHRDVSSLFVRDSLSLFNVF